MLPSQTKRTFLSGLAATLSLLFSTSIQADIIVVDKFSDDPSGNPNACQLRDAIEAANTDSSVGGCPAGNGADEIRFDSYQDELISVNDHLPVITEPLAITGLGAHRLTIHGNSYWTLLYALDTEVSVRGLTLYKGANSGLGACLQLIDTVATVRDVILEKCEGDSTVAIAGEAAKVSFTNVEFRENQTDQGGGVLLLYQQAQFDGNRLQFVNNYADGNLIRLNYSYAQISNSVVRDNNTFFSTLTVEGGSLWLSESTIVRNHHTHSSSGAIRNTGTINLVRTVVASNTQGSSGNPADVSPLTDPFVSHGGNFVGSNGGNSGIFPVGAPNGDYDWVGTDTSPLHPDGYVRVGSGGWAKN